MNSSVMAHNGSGNIWFCEKSRTYPRSRGIFFGDNPLHYLLPVLLLQISLTTSLSNIIHFLLSPLGQGTFITYMLSALLLGPSMFGKLEPIKAIFFPPKSYYVSETLAFFGCMLFMFIVAVKMDISTVLRSGRKTWAIGLLTFALPLLTSSIFAFLLSTFLAFTPTTRRTVMYTSFFLSISSFHVIACQLADLKLLNTELGRLAVTSSMISGTISWVWVTILVTIKQSHLANSDTCFWMILSLMSLVAFILLVLRPIMLWMIRRTPEGRPIKEGYVNSVLFMVLICALFGECIGQHFFLGPILLGLAVPDGPPLGSALVEKLDTFVSTIMLPLYFLFSGANFKFSLIELKRFVVVELLALSSFWGKVIGAMLPSLYFHMPLVDAFCLGLSMSAQGITDIIYIQTASYLYLIDEESYSLMVLTTVLLTAAATPTIKFLYDPSKRYQSLNRRRTIEHANPNEELRFMACIHNERSAPSIFHLLEMSNPTHDNPLCFYLLHLIQLTGRSSPLLIDHRRRPRKNHLANAFRMYETYMDGKIAVNVFTSVSPYETMHDEICMLAALKRTSILIMPFHQQWTVNTVTESSNAIRAVNRHVLRTAPCSVGILVERGILGGNSTTNVTWYSVGVIFIEGSDDREALAYAMRMAEHENVRVTVIRFVDPRKGKSKTALLRGDQDGDILHKYKVGFMGVKRHDYREEVAVDSVELVNVVRTLEGCFDLVLVGRRHSSELSFFKGMSVEWNEFPELGFVGDMLVSSHSNFDTAVMVVQQHRLGCDDRHINARSRCNDSINSEQAFSIVQVPRDSEISN